MYRSLSIEITIVDDFFLNYDTPLLNYDTPLLDCAVNVLIRQIYQQSTQSPISGTIENSFRLVTKDYK